MRGAATAVAIALALVPLASAPAGEPTAYTPSAALKETKLIPENGPSNAQVGQSVSLSGDTALAGAPDDINENGTLAGAAYVWVRTADGWSEQAKLLPSDGEPFNNVGLSVALSGDTAVVSAHHDDSNALNAGAAYVFVRTGGTWTEQAKLLARDGESSDLLGWAVAVSGDTALVAAKADDNDKGSLAGAVYVFVRTADVWTEQAKLLPQDGESGDQFGYSVSLAGNVALIGSPFDDDNGNNSGSAYIFVRAGGTWTEREKLLPNDGASLDFFGRSVSLSGPGRTALIGATGDDDQGSFSGSAYVFVSEGQEWNQQAKLVASDGGASDRFGYSVSIVANTAVVGAKDHEHNGVASGSAYVFRRNEGMWAERVELLPSDGQPLDLFSESVSIHGNTVLVGANLDDNENGQAAGAAYAYERNHELSIAGACPGQVTVEAQGAEPHGTVALFGSEALGSDDLQAGRCTGTAIELAEGVYLATVSADADGAFSAAIDVEARACGLFLQAVDLESCALSDIARVPLR